MTKYIFAKIGEGNRHAGHYLKGKSEVDFPAVPIYFDCHCDHEEDFLKKGGAKNQGELFFECGHNNEGKFIVVIHEGFVHILRPIGRVEFHKSTVRENESGYVKILPVEILKTAALAAVPVVLASIGANRYYSSGTFREISDIGNIRAIQTVIGQPVEIPDDPSLVHALECLSSVEFETLIAKVFEEAGCFVPAYRGGVMPGADLFAYNKSNRAISVGTASIEAAQRKSIQVKLRASSISPPPGIDLLVATNVKEDSVCLGVEWLRSALAQNGGARAWLRSSLDWLPPSYVHAVCGAS